MLFVPSTNAATDLQARKVVVLFFNACVSHYPDFTRTEDWIEKVGLPELQEKYSKVFLGGRKGKAWAATDDSGEYVVTLIYEDSACSAIARRADTTMVAQYLERAFATKKMKLRNDGFEIYDEQGFRRVATTYRGVANGLDFTILLSLSDSSSAPVQALITMY